MSQFTQNTIIPMSPSPGSSGRSVSLSFTVQKQQLSKWCWSAVAASVNHFYAHAGKTQCTVANAVLGKGGSTSCCTTSNHTACNQFGDLRTALQKVSSFHTAVLTALGPTALESELGASHPVCAVMHGSGTSHIVVVYGYEITGGQVYLHVADPSGPTVSLLGILDFTSNYLSTLAWTQSCTTAG